jgi:hypothetical protein
VPLYSQIIWARNCDVLGQSGLCSRAATGKGIKALLMECPRILYTDLDTSWLLSIFGDVECRGTFAREIQKLPPRNGAVFTAFSLKCPRIMSTDVSDLRCNTPLVVGAPGVAAQRMT